VKNSPTIKDIAAKLNLHYTTVSRALRDHPDVKEETRRQVKELARQMNYQPNYLARSLKRQKSNSIGVIVPEIRHHFFSAVISGIEAVASEAGYVILVAQSNERVEREIINTNVFIANHVAGLIVSISQSTHSSDHFKPFLERGKPLVFFDRVCEDLATSAVVVNDYEGAFNATEFLIRKGYRNIAHLAGSKNLPISNNRFQGYRDALKKYGIALNKQFVYWGGLQEENGKLGMEKLLRLKKPPEAVFAVNDPVAIGAYETINKHHLKIPDDIAVVGFSDNPISAVVSPPLTTVHQPAYEMGRRACEILLQQIENSESPRSHKKIMLPTQLIIRDSA